MQKSNPSIRNCKCQQTTDELRDTSLSLSLNFSQNTRFQPQFSFASDTETQIYKSFEMFASKLIGKTVSNSSESLLKEEIRYRVESFRLSCVHGQTADIADCVAILVNRCCNVFPLSSRTSKHRLAVWDTPTRVVTFCNYLNVLKDQVAETPRTLIKLSTEDCVNEVVMNCIVVGHAVCIDIPSTAVCRDLHREVELEKRRKGNEMKWFRDSSFHFSKAKLKTYFFTDRDRNRVVSVCPVGVVWSYEPVLEDRPLTLSLRISIDDRLKYCCLNRFGERQSIESELKTVKSDTVRLDQPLFV